ncbi:MerR family transcriptional regulator [Microbacterium sp. dk485]|uniref:MerR family transcriptional regulator n=1 Tax=Microbacterium wangchenii TaxID=2541726 RepID=A0ABX5STH4_9MICO|nr:MerR family transcriptional regulator [Microbacterium sp. EYE_512]QBR89475.1 MerR family transcriptional regulator [Microbacterium wangchenii]TFV81461.1 MerR family transcriptional regulator [Microbacterium sp. dk485]TXK09009.1 MerR family transcriptional regulator [Microbacterium wangchenii]
MTSVVDTEIDEGATVGVAADLLGLTVRTLHHWDEIGLASPSRRTPAGYRLYTWDDLERLSRVVAYREAGLTLDAIRVVLDDATADIGDKLREQRAQLAERIHDLQQLDERLERLTDAHERGILMSDVEQREIFGEEWDPQQSRAARFVWGGSRQWAQFAERSASRSPAQWRALSEAMSSLQHDLAAAVSRGVEPGSAEADQLAERHRELFSNFFPLTRQMQVCLGRMFEADPGFSSYYNGIGDGLATWFRQSIDESARHNGIDPDTATWE